MDMILVHLQKESVSCAATHAGVWEGVDGHFEPPKKKTFSNSAQNKTAASENLEREVILHN